MTKKKNEYAIKKDGKMAHGGLAKLLEECGELQQVIGKLLQYPDLQDTYTKKHPDGTILLARIEDEIADVLAAVMLVEDRHALDVNRIRNRILEKFALFQEWDNGKPNQGAHTSTRIVPWR